MSPINFVSGETLLYLGKNYQLEITDDQLPNVRFHSRFLISRCHQETAFQLLGDWYTKRAYIKLPQKVKDFAESLGVQFNQILRVLWHGFFPLSKPLPHGGRGFETQF